MDFTVTQSNQPSHIVAADGRVRPASYKPRKSKPDLTVIQAKNPCGPCGRGCGVESTPISLERRRPDLGNGRASRARQSAPFSGVNADISERRPSEHPWDTPPGQPARARCPYCAAHSPRNMHAPLRDITERHHRWSRTSL